MKTYLDCIPCFMSQALRAARLASDDDAVIKQVLDKTAGFIQKMPMENTPPQTGEHIYSYVSEITGNKDPYSEIKKQNINKAFDLYEYFNRWLSAQPDRLKGAIMLSIAGNIIDLGYKGHIDIENEIVEILGRFTDMPDFEFFKEKLEQSDKILILGDNSGEAVFDRFLLEFLKNKPKTVYAVRDIPVINDITRVEADLIGIGEFAEVLSSGVKAPGTILSQASNEFLDIFNNSDMIISKGQGNYEALSEVDRDIFFLLIAKCPVIARDLGTKTGTPHLVYKRHSASHLK